VAASFFLAAVYEIARIMHLIKGRREILLAMATGTGKTRTCIGLIYRLIKSGRFERVLFLVDRTALGIQAQDAFGSLRIENQQTFENIYDIKKIDDFSPDSDTRLQIATVQGMMHRLFGEDGGMPQIPVDQYDCIVVDECHRGYTLDKEMSDGELEFRSEADYVSKYRRVIEYFDAVKIGLTATPALHTKEIFGDPAYVYSYRQAVIDGYLVDHEPPVQIYTALAQDGIVWKVGEEMAVYRTSSDQLDLFNVQDEVAIEIEHFNKEVETESFNQVVCEELARQIDPTMPGKTMVFCATDNHADMVVRLLKAAFDARYGEVDDDAVQKITGRSDKPMERIRNYKNERLPSVAVTVDLLTTGIDVPAITNLVFLRRVRSRILYEQMLGRATRLCADLFGKGEDKEVFRVFDAVDLYSALLPWSSMKPVVTNPSVTFESLVADLDRATSGEAVSLIKDQLLAKLQRNKKKLSGETLEKFKGAAGGISPADLIRKIQTESGDDLKRWFKGCPQVAPALDSIGPMSQRGVIISHHKDELRSVERGYGKGEKPEDYLESFGRYIEENKNRISALMIVLQRPKELTRQQLRELKFTLDEAGYSETALRTAWRETTNEEIAASIIGFIRQQSLGTPLKPYKDRVNDALKKILSEHQWTSVQRDWLNRIAKQLLKETIVDKSAFEHGQFAQRGGFEHINKAFDGHLESLITQLTDQIWTDAG